MVFYFLAVRHWVKDVNKVACIEIAGNRKVNLSDVKSITCLMNRPAMPIRNITFKQEDAASASASIKRRGNDGPISMDETLGETLQRLKKGEDLKKHVRRRGATSNVTNNKRHQQQPGLQNRKGASSKTPASSRWQRDKAKRASEPALSKTSLAETAALESAPAHETVAGAPPSTGVVTDYDTDDVASTKSFKNFRRGKIKNLLQEKLKTSLTFGREPVIEFDFDANDFFGGSESSDITASQDSYDVFAGPAAKDEEPEKEEKVKAKEPKEEGPERQNRKSAMKVSTLEESLLVATRNHPMCRLRTSDTAPVAPPRRRSFATTIDSNDDSSDSSDLISYPAYPGDDSVVSSRDGRLRWGNIVIREYSQCLGDNPACSNGVPLQLDWDYQLLDIVRLDEFEAAREISRQNKASLRMPSSYRKALMLKLGYTASDLAAVNRIKIRDQKRRIQTVARLKYMAFGERVENMVKVFPAPSPALQPAMRAR